ncbi:MAG TPA: PilZ domain-containing protein [Thermoanaerobaculia bacterium]|nr:PilZ domain-containing protein [Thermoanaerobaculia bacterium]
MTPSQRPVRRFPRVSSQLPVRLRILGERRPEALTRTQIVSAGGCMLVSDRSIGFGSLMEVTISCDGQLLRADGRVAWEKRKSPNEHEVGVEFLRITPRDRAVLEQLVAAKLDSTAA